jgi:hypothetical protein
MTRDVTAAVVHSRADAELMAGMLRDHGVPAWVSTDDAGGVEAALQAQGVRVMVPAIHAHEARELVGEKPAENGELNVFQRWVVRLLGGQDSSSAT